MREKKKCLVITFAKTIQAMAMEDACRRCGKKGRLIPLPREIAAGCGLCFRTEETEEERWVSFLQEEGIPYEQIRELWLP